MKKTKLKEVVNCRDCMDEKVCKRCRGDGIVAAGDGRAPAHGDPENDECHDCAGSGRCCWCAE